ncbi:MAG TPA: hypothetical protein VIF39_02200, partial [Hyphomicrobium sp.]
RKEPMFVDGIYEIAFARRNQSVRADNRAILVCRSGTLFGADPRGRIYRGMLHPSAKRAMRKSFLSAFYESPPRSRPPPRTAAPRGNAVPVSGEIDSSARSQSTTIFVGRKAVDIEITYIGPLPP